MCLLRAFWWVIGREDNSRLTINLYKVVRCATQTQAAVKVATNVSCLLVRCTGVTKLQEYFHGKSLSKSLDSISVTRATVADKIYNKHYQSYSIHEVTTMQYKKQKMCLFLPRNKRQEFNTSYSKGFSVLPDFFFITYQTLFYILKNYHFSNNESMPNMKASTLSCYDINITVCINFRCLSITNLFLSESASASQFP